MCQNMLVVVYSVNCELTLLFLTLSSEVSDKQGCSTQLSIALHRELVNWGKKPTSSEFQQRYSMFEVLAFFGDYLCKYSIKRASF